jgi:hypothetical protein
MEMRDPRDLPSHLSLHPRICAASLRSLLRPGMKKVRKATPLPHPRKYRQIPGEIFMSARIAGGHRRFEYRPVDRPKLCLCWLSGWIFNPVASFASGHGRSFASAAPSAK